MSITMERSKLFDSRPSLPRGAFRALKYTAYNCQQHSPNEGKDVAPKPDLRKAARNDRPVKVIAAACVLALIYMYPMIFKPMFGFGEESGEEQKEKIKQMGIELDKHRPSNMPEWKSPFAPKADGR